MSSEQSQGVPEITPPFPSDHWRDGEIERQLTRLRRIIARRRVFAYSFTGVWIVLFVGVALYATALPESKTWPNILLALFCVGIPIGFLFVVPTREQRRVTMNIAGIDDIAALGAMLEARSVTENRSTARVLREATARVLLRVKASDRHRFSDRHYRLLRSAIPERLEFVREHLQPGKTEFTIALLKAVEQIGDATFVDRVERLTRDRARTYGQRRVKAAAEECLVNLRARLDDTGAVLLRIPELHESDGTLLRPVQAASTMDSATLLRTPHDPNT